jgi:hypothetical protein
LGHAISVRSARLKVSAPYISTTEKEMYSAPPIKIYLKIISMHKVSQDFLEVKAKVTCKILGAREKSRLEKTNYQVLRNETHENRNSPEKSSPKQQSLDPRHSVT